MVAEYINHTSAQAGGHLYGYLPSQLRVRRGAANNIPFEEIRSGTGSGFRFAAEAFAKVVAERVFAAIARPRPAWTTPPRWRRWRAVRGWGMPWTWADVVRGTVLR